MVMPCPELCVQPIGNCIAGIGHGIIINIADLIFAGQPFHIAQMVAMVVGNNHRVNLVHVLTHSGSAQGHLESSPAPVAQLVLFVVAHVNHDLALPILQQNGITLAHVQHGDAQPALGNFHFPATRGQGRSSTGGHCCLAELLLHRGPHSILMGLIKQRVGKGSNKKSHQHLDN